MTTCFQQSDQTGPPENIPARPLTGVVLCWFFLIGLLMLTNVTIRPPSVDELAIMVSMGEQFWNLTNYAQLIPYIKEDVLVSCEVMREQGLLLAAFDKDNIAGFIGGLQSPSYTNFGIKIGQELFFWVEPKYRNSKIGSLLLQAIEQQAKDLGLVYWTQIYLVNVEPDKTKYLYERSGYKQTEIGFTKQLRNI